MKYTIDRIEEGIAVCETEDGNILNIDVAFLPVEVNEGDIIEEADGRYTVCADETAERRSMLASRQKSIFKRKK